MNGTSGVQTSLTDEPSDFTVALLPWGDVIDDYLDSIGISLEDFCKEMTGGWLFGYVEALREVNVRIVIVCVSSRVSAPVRRRHRLTGAAIWILPSPKRYQRIRGRMVQSGGWTAEEIFGTATGFTRLLNTALHNIGPYAATPLVPLVRVLQEENCDAILCQEYEDARFDLCIALGKLLGLPVSASFQGGDVQRTDVERFIRPWSLRACNGLIIATQTEIDRVKETYGFPGNKIAKVFNPLDVGAWHAGNGRTTRKDLDFPPAARVAVWHGRVEVHRKGLDVLLDAWDLVTSEHPDTDLRLLLIGTGSDANNLRRTLASRHLRGVHWIDKYILDRAALRDYLTAADVYVFPSRHEGFPVAPMEAMACGLPVVASAAPGIPDILGGQAPGGLVVPRENAEALASALGVLIADQDRSRELGKQAQQRAEKSFSYAAVGEQLRSLLMQQAADHLVYHTDGAF